MSATLASSFPAPAQPTSISVPALARWFIFFVLAIGCFSGPLDIAEGTGGDSAARVAKAPSLLLKLANAGAASLLGVWGMFCLPLARRYLTSIPGLMLCAVASVFALTCLTSIKPSASIPICLVFIAYLLFIPTALAVLGLRGSMVSALLGCTLFSLGAIFLYYCVPRIGVFAEDLDNGVIVERMGGMSQPNHVGRTALIGLLLTTYFLRVVPKPQTRLWLSGLICIFTLVGLLAMSRTALLGVMICLVILNLDLLFTRIGLTATWLAVVGGVAVLFSVVSRRQRGCAGQKIVGCSHQDGRLGRSNSSDRALRYLGTNGQADQRASSARLWSGFQQRDAQGPLAINAQRFVAPNAGSRHLRRWFYVAVVAVEFDQCLYLS